MDELYQGRIFEEFRIQESELISGGPKSSTKYSPWVFPNSRPLNQGLSKELKPTYLFISCTKFPN